jgi:hypothetical protein
MNTGAQRYPPLSVETKQSILDVVLQKKVDARRRRSEYENMLHTKSKQDQDVYHAGHREVWIRQDNVLEVLMTSLFGGCFCGSVKLRFFDILTEVHCC